MLPPFIFVIYLCFILGWIGGTGWEITTLISTTWRKKTGQFDIINVYNIYAPSESSKIITTTFWIINMVIKCECIRSSSGFPSRSFGLVWFGFVHYITLYVSVCVFVCMHGYLDAPHWNACNICEQQIYTVIYLFLSSFKLYYISVSFA